MSTYKEIKGTDIQNFSSDPANPLNGQVWYNTTSGTIKVASVTTGPGSYSTCGNLPSARSKAAGAGTQTSALGFGGDGATCFQSATEEWTGAAPTTVTITAS